ncbi:unnamed protein product [Pylaiella littoralis]
MPSPNSEYRLVELFVIVVNNCCHCRPSRHDNVLLYVLERVDVHVNWVKVGWIPDVFDIDFSRQNLSRPRYHLVHFSGPTRCSTWGYIHAIGPSYETETVMVDVKPMSL